MGSTRDFLLKNPHLFHRYEERRPDVPNVFWLLTYETVLHVFHGE